MENSILIPSKNDEVTCTSVYALTNAPAMSGTAAVKKFIVMVKMSYFSLWNFIPQEILGEIQGGIIGET